MYETILISVFLLFIYVKLGKLYEYWEEKGVPQCKPHLLFGNFAGAVFCKTSMSEIVDKIYQSFPNSRYVGLYQFLQPTLMIRDPDLIKQITVKDFDHFPDHRPLAPPDVDPLWNKNLLGMRAEDGWHATRTTLSPAFTTSKIKAIFGLVQQRARGFVHYFREQKRDLLEVELKDAFSRYANDVIASTIFGVDCNSLRDRENKFYMMGSDAANFAGLRSLKFFCYGISRKLMKLFNVTIFSQQVREFFGQITKEAIQIRKTGNLVRNDILHLLLEAQKGRLKADATAEDADSATTPNSTNKSRKVEITDDDITAHIFIFFLGGFETVSTSLAYAAYRLAVHPQVQEKLCAEIAQTLEKHGTINYKALSKMKYLDCVMTEILRLHAPAIILNRFCTKDYVIEPTKNGEKRVEIPKGTTIWIPVQPIQKDARFYENPDDFDPERFNDENRQNVKAFTYLPFGVGPRNCIGSRFALLECKLILAELLVDFEFVPIDRTQVPIRLSGRNPLPLPDGGIWIGFKKRE